MKTNVTSTASAVSKQDVKRMVTWMTAGAWVSLSLGLLLSLLNIGHFSDQNYSLMIGMGFMVGSVFIYVIRTAIHLVHVRMQELSSDQGRS